jgi:chromosome segregation protein
MLYLDEVAIHNFKSFKNATIKFNKGFNCIVGPNGSGKSNICDALLFALGETSPKRMRITSSIQLINNTLKTSREEDGYKRASVKVKFSGDKDIEIIRAIRSDKKIAYRLDGKRVTRQEIIDTLAGFKGNINETNTMTQGEITYLLSQSPKERREMIDVAAGIKEYNDKKDDAMKELSKVEMKLSESRLILNERAGFLSELEKDKTAAEKYLQLSSSIKQMQYTILKTREKEVETSYAEAAKQLAAKSDSEQKLEKQINDLNLDITAQTSERDRLSKSLSAKSTELGSTNKIIEEVNKNIAINTTEARSTAEGIKTTKERIGYLNGEAKKHRAKEKENEDLIKKYAFEAEVKGRDLPEIMESAGDKETSTLNERFNSNYKKAEELETKLMAASSEYSKLSSDYGSMSREILEIHKSMNEWGAKRTTLTNNIKSSKEALSNLQKTREEVSKDLTKEEARIKELNGTRDSLDTENINLREQLAHAGREPSGNAEAIRKELGETFHGKAQDICTYNDRYALAVQAAAGGRFGYFVVESIDDANRAIGILKAKKLGRASFIPIKEVSVKEGKAPEGAKPILDYVSYDKKYKKVFSYVFANTYLVDDIKAAQGLGIGSYRYVTLEGDIVEPSGIVTGGSSKSALSASALESRLKKVEADRRATIERINETNATLVMIRKKIGNYDTEIINYDLELKHSLAGENEANRNMDALNEKIKNYEMLAKEIKDKIDTLRTEKEREETSIRLLKEENAAIRDRINGMMASKARGSRSKEDADKLKALREEVENLKLKAATTSKENDMLKSIIENLEKEIKENTNALNILNDKHAQLEKEQLSLNRQRSELLVEVEGHDKKSKGMFKELQVLDEKLEKLGKERGKLEADLDRLGRDAIELEGRKSQFQTRLADIKAELMSYPKMEMTENTGAEDLEKKVFLAKTDLERLGNVNLKAPEMYEVRKRDVEEAQKKMETLESEKTSIMSMIDQIETKKLGVFMETLDSVDKNFEKLFGYIFDGSTKLYLANPKDPFNSGLLVDIHLGNKKHNLDLMSGGQKSLIALMLLFAIQMRTPMSFYVFDEIDVALDKENSKKLSTLIRQLSQKSQFIVVSHNDSLIAAADTAIGVVHNSNESQVVGVQLVGKQ